MPTKPKILRWGLTMGYLGIITSMLACMAIGLGTSNVDSGTLQIDNGSVEVKGLNGEWRPVAGASTFELVGALKSMNPWVVAGTTLETNETTTIHSRVVNGWRIPLNAQKSKPIPALRS